MSDEIGERQLAVELAAMRAELHGLSAKVTSLEMKVDMVTAQANRWKGAFGAILGVGAVIGAIATMGLQVLGKR